LTDRPKAYKFKLSKKYILPKVLIKEKMQEQHYEQKKVIFKFNQIVWYFLGLIEVLIMFRIIFKAFGANLASSFVRVLYALSDPFVFPFRGLFRDIREETLVFELSSFIALLVYFVIAYGIIELARIFKPTSPKEVEEEV
jgi:uncharacterized protein YggT (Ycf19 family)